MMRFSLIEHAPHQTFEPFKKVKDHYEFWSARKLARALEYSEYCHFLPVIEIAKEVFKNSGDHNVDHIEDILDMIDIGKGGGYSVPM